MESINVINTPGEGEYEEKKSRFIGHAFPVSGEEEALRIIEQVKRKYWDARHNCYAFITGENGEILRFSDDGEPGGTAGRPILDVLTGAGLRGALIVVTRYFGGTLLGTGGLVRAYTAASKEALANADIRQLVFSSRVKVTVDYTDWGRIQHYLTQSGIFAEGPAYTDKIEVVLRIGQPDISRILDEITGLTNGKCEIAVIDTGYFAL